MLTTVGLLPCTPHCGPYEHMKQEKRCFSGLTCFRLQTFKGRLIFHILSCKFEIAEQLSLCCSKEWEKCHCGLSGVQRRTITDVPGIISNFIFFTDIANWLIVIVIIIILKFWWYIWKIIKVNSQIHKSIIKIGSPGRLHISTESFQLTDKMS